MFLLSGHFEPWVPVGPSACFGGSATLISQGNAVGITIFIPGLGTGQLWSQVETAKVPLGLAEDQVSDWCHLRAASTDAAHMYHLALRCDCPPNLLSAEPKALISTRSGYETLGYFTNEGSCCRTESTCRPFLSVADTIKTAKKREIEALYEAYLQRDVVALNQNDPRLGQVVMALVDTAKKQELLRRTLRFPSGSVGRKALTSSVQQAMHEAIVVEELRQPLRNLITADFVRMAVMDGTHSHELMSYMHFLGWTGCKEGTADLCRLLSKVKIHVDDVFSYKVLLRLIPLAQVDGGVDGLLEGLLMGEKALSIAQSCYGNFVMGNWLSQCGDKGDTVAQELVENLESCLETQGHYCIQTWTNVTTDLPLLCRLRVLLEDAHGTVLPRSSEKKSSAQHLLRHVLAAIARLREV